jgi:hypothetical protein
MNVSWVNFPLFWTYFFVSRIREWLDHFSSWLVKVDGVVPSHDVEKTEIF